MLKHLSITNYAIIERVELSFDNGFTVITGETGAGKSILLGALSLILGKRADSSDLNNKEKKCIVEGEFVFPKENYADFFLEHDLDYEDVNIIRREINSNGKSRAFINDTPVSLVVLKELTSQLVDIHSQHETLQVRNSKFQVDVIDAFAGLNEMRHRYSKKYAEYVIKKNELNELIQIAGAAKTDKDYIAFQVKEIEELNLKVNEKEEIESELEVVNNVEEIKSVLNNAGISLFHSDQNILTELKSVAQSFSRINNRSKAYNDLYERLTSLVIELEDIVHEIERENQGLNFDQENINYLNERLSKIFSIEQKHQVSSTEEIIDLLEKFRLQLKDSDSYEEKIADLTHSIHKIKEDLNEEASALSKERIKNFDGLTSKITSSLSLLGMQDATFEVQHNLLSELTENGIDDITFLFTSNKGTTPKELSKTASGGELSRLMLSIKAILAGNKNLDSIIFDEIDTGVSGEIAHKMAGIMKQMSTNMQVIAITHLPQVAAKGEIHYKIYKENRNGRTVTLLSMLDKADRVEELAKMLSGEDLSSAARENAKTLLKV